MSLKAKLEAVIYAAEEPVTLAQLASLFAEDALAYRAEEIQRKEELRQKLVIEEESGSATGQVDSAPELAELLAVVDGLQERQSGLLAQSELILNEPPKSEPSPIEIGGLSFTSQTLEAEDAGATEAQEESPDPKKASSVDPKPAITPEDAELEARRLELKRNREVREILRGILDELIADYASDARGIDIREIAGGFRMSTKPEIHDAVRSFVKSLKPALKLSLPALETLAVIAYKQPVTAPEVGEIRGVDSAGVLGSLMSRKLITTAGRKQVIGRPMLYKTTKEFLLRFGLKDVNELPSMEEFEKIAALELSETDEAESAGESYAEAAAASGDLFAAEEPAEVNSENRAPESEVQTAIAVSTPTAEPSEEAAEAHATVERQSAEEFEAEHEEASN